MSPSSVPDVVAVDVGGTTIKVELLDDQAVPIRRIVEPTPHGPTAATQVTNAIARMIEQHQAFGRPIGVVVPGLVDSDHGIAIFSSAFGWHDAPLAAMLHDLTSSPVMLGHDVTAGGIAEREIGAGAESDQVAVIVIGTGIAAALWLDGRRVTGSPVGEIGHIAFAPEADGETANGPPCGCGRSGCLESVASASAIARRYSEQTGTDVASAAEVVALLDTDRVADDVWESAMRSLAQATLALTATIGTRRVVLTGGLANAGKHLLGPVQRWASELATIEPVPEIVLGAFGDRSVIVGAGMLARRLR